MYKISDYLTQENNFLIAKKDCSLILNLDDYEIDNNIQFLENQIWLGSLISRIQFSDKNKFDLILDYSVEINGSNMEKTENLIILTFSEGEIILSTSYGTDNIKEQVQYVERLLGGKEIYKDVSHLYNKLFKIFESSGSDSVHIETLISQVLRDQANTAFPARMGKTWNPIMMNIKELVFQTGFLQSLAFENVNKAIVTGLITEEQLEASPLEKILTGELK